MRFGYHLLAWRENKRLSQVQLAEKARVLRPYLSRLERDDADPSLSMVFRLASALEVLPGKLLDEMPPVVELDRFKLDGMAREFLKKDRRSRIGEQALRKLRIQLGEKQWKAFLKRIQKLAPYEA
jgi:transcriptional regulator with XRE-family HTH domain